MYTIWFVGHRSTTWSYLVVLLVFCSILQRATAQLHLFITKEDANTHLKMNFQGRLYLIRDGEPNTMVQNPGAFYRFMSPLDSSVSTIQLSWFSSPQVSHYSMNFKSSDHSIMPDPHAATPLEGIVPQSQKAFQVSFYCPGTTEGEVDMTFSLNYTRIVSGSVDTEEIKSFMLTVRRQCEKTGGNDNFIEQVTSSPWSRSKVVGICAGLTTVIISVVGLVLLFRYCMRQRKLKIEFEDDVEMYRSSSSSSKIYKKEEQQEEEVDETVDSSKPGLFYSPPRPNYQPPGGGGGGGRGRANTSGSDSSTTDLIIPEESSDMCIQKQSEGKYSSRDGRHGVRHKHRRHERQWKHGSLSNTKYTWIQERPLSSYHETESLLERRNTPDEAQNTGGLFTVLNEFWATELADVLIPRDQVSVGDPLYRGTFGCLYKGSVRGLSEEQPRKKMEVSIKALQDEADMDTITSFMQEAMVIKGFKHPNVVELVGVVLQRSTPPYIVTPLTRNGDLGHFLKISRATSARVQTITSRQLIEFGIEICKGMDYITQKKIVHRNLAAKNCIVNDDLSIKITDFSLARDVNTTNLNDKGIRSRLLVKWTALEGLAEEGQFSEKSDVWSFGVVLWEIVTLAKAPYQAIDSSKMEQHLQAGHRLPQPNNCPYDLYFLMKNCWESSPKARPTFSLLLKQLEHYSTRLVQNGLKFEYLPESDC
ncbi:cytoplasmic tyrosine-protein kinase BMX-like isoform X3 [Pocillopora damicornis]|uniref:cytoplasmic tyrosine-protein kinase BMX-like isoform X3 n=1 Tax=Pocillopora damicornis TaxID=46731 RepID=UPI000F55204B|nr:cytoplasmic tyrosine-protein kinase BMX-like isoform X3 [Pocillopora damicornis]